MFSTYNFNLQGCHSCSAYHLRCHFQASAARKLAWHEDRYSGVFGLCVCMLNHLPLNVSSPCFQYTLGFSIINTCLSYQLLRVPQYSTCASVLLSYHLAHPAKLWLLPSLSPRSSSYASCARRHPSSTLESSIGALKAPSRLHEPRCPQQ